MNLTQITDMLGFTNSRQEGTPSSEKRIPKDFEPATLGAKEVYLSWEAESRPAQQFFNTKLTNSLMVIGVVVVIIFAILQEYLLILAIVSVIFVSNVLSKTPPERLHFEVSSHGLLYSDQIYYWPEMQRFFFIDQNGQTVLAVDMVSGIPSRIFVTLRPGDREKIKEIFSQHLHFLETPPESSLDRAYKSLIGKFDSSPK